MKAGIQKLFSIAPKGPLNGYLVLELGNLISGPMASEELARKGALVIKLETKQGDSARGILSKAVFSSCNAAKASITLDKTNIEDVHLYQELLELADVIIDNRSPDAKTRDEVLQPFLAQKKSHPVIFCSIVGYDSSEFHDKSALDVAVQAQTGMAMVNGASPGSPLKVGFVVIDIVTALQAASTIKDHLLALARGLKLSSEMNNVIVIEQSMAKTAALLMTGQYINTYTQQRDIYRDGNRDLFVAPFSFYKTKNGMISIGIIGDPLFATFCDKVLGDKTLALKYPTNQSRLENPQFDKDLNDILATKDSEDWIAACKDHGIVCTKVNTVLEMLRHPFAKKMITATQAGVPIIADSATSSAFPEEALRDAPSVDQDRKAIMALVATKQDLPEVLRFQEIYQLFLQHYPGKPPLLLYRHDRNTEQARQGGTTEMDLAWQQSVDKEWPFSPLKGGTLRAKL